LGGAVEIANGRLHQSGKLEPLIPYNVNTQNIRQRFWTGPRTTFSKNERTMIKGNTYPFGGSYQRNFNYSQPHDNGQGIHNQIGLPDRQWRDHFNSLPIHLQCDGNQSRPHLFRVWVMVSQPQVAYTRSGAI